MVVGTLPPPPSLITITSFSGGGGSETESVLNFLATNSFVGGVVPRTAVPRGPWHSNLFLFRLVILFECRIPALTRGSNTGLSSPDSLGFELIPPLLLESTVTSLCWIIAGVPLDFRLVGGLNGEVSLLDLRAAEGLFALGCASGP